MYSRKLSSLLISFGSKFQQKHVAGIKTITSSLLSSSSSSSIVETKVKIPNISLITDRNFCTSTRPPNKDEIAEMQMKEFVKDPENKRLFDIIKLEVEVMRQNGENVPEKLRPRDWYELILSPSRGKRRRLLDFLFGIERKKEHEKEKKALKRDERDKYFAENDDPTIPEHLQYKLGANTPFLRLYDTTINNHYNWQLMKASMFGTKIIVDCGFEQDMTRSEVKNCAKQLQLSFAANRAHRDPFDLHYYNLNTSGMLHSDFYAFIPTMYDPTFPINLTQKSYLEDFKKEELIYLTPDATIEMKEFNHNATYIIGAIVDKISGKPLSLAKAKREGIKMVKLPMDTYLHFGSGSGKSLTINQMVDILLDLKMTNDWEFALRHVPKRKLFDSRQNAMERKARRYLAETSKEAQAYTAPRDFTLEARKKFQIKK